MAHFGTDRRRPRRSTLAWLASGFGATIAMLATSVALLVVELITAMLVYIYVAIYHLETFGYLVRLSRDLLNFLAGLIDQFFAASSANQAYATLIGELGPKSMLLLLIGLAVGAVIRFATWAIGRLVMAGRIRG